jgi:hypothetical protein
MYPTVAAYCLLTYWTDKFLLIKFYKQPPNFSTKLAKGTLVYLKWAFIFHLIFNVWSYGSRAIFSTDPYAETNFTGP